MVKFSSLSKVAFAAIAMQFAANNANAAIYTAIASGAYTSASTWSGGNVPPAVLVTDQVYIGSAFTVTTNQAHRLNGPSSSMTVEGTLDASAGGSIDLSQGSLVGAGDIMADSVHLGNTLTLTFTGTIDAENMSSDGLSFLSGADIMVSGNLWLEGGVLDIASGTLYLDNNANLMFSGGDLGTSGTGMINVATGGYNAVYTEGASTTGWAMANAGLRNLEIRTTGTNAVMLSSDLTVNGMLKLTSGMLNLNGHNLTVNGSLASTGSGMIHSMNTSDIIINSTSTTGGMLMFDAAGNGNTVNDLTINNTGANNIIDLNSDLNVDGDLHLMAGKLDINDNDLYVKGMIDHTAGTGNYIVTGANGHLMMDLTTGNSGMFYIGTESMYAPIMVMANNGSTGGRVGANVNTNVYVNSTSGATLNGNQPLVNATWHVMTDATANINMNVQPMWMSGMEVNGFDRSGAYVSTYTGGHWSAGIVGSATTSNGLYMLPGMNVTGTNNAVAVFDKDANTTSVSNISASEAFAIYPNPVTSALNFRVPAGTQVNAVTVMDVAGRVIQHTQLNGTSSVSVSELPAGLYNVQLEGNNFKAVQKFVKQ